MIKVIDPLWVLRITKERWYCTWMVDILYIQFHKQHFKKYTHIFKYIPYIYINTFTNPHYPKPRRSFTVRFLLEGHSLELEAFFGNGFETTKGGTKTSFLQIRSD